MQDYLISDVENAGQDCRQFAMNIRAAARGDGDVSTAVRAACAQAKEAAEDLQFKVRWLERELDKA